MPTTTPRDKSGTVRPNTIVLGTDGKGRDHIYRTATETIWIIDETRVHATFPAISSYLGPYMREVEDAVGWATVEDGPLVQEKAVPRKWDR